MPALTRRGILRSAAALAGGIGVAGGVKASAAESSPAGFAGLVLTATGLAAIPSRAAAGDVLTTTGTLTHGNDSGTVYVTRSVLAAARLLTPGAGTFEQHLFDLPGGTITGSGVLQHDGTGSFTVTGGSGAYLAARGAYTVTESREFGGNVATYDFTGA